MPSLGYLGGEAEQESAVGVPEMACGANLDGTYTKLFERSPLFLGELFSESILRLFICVRWCPFCWCWLQWGFVSGSGLAGAGMDIVMEANKDVKQRGRPRLGD